MHGAIPRRICHALLLLVSSWTWLSAQTGDGSPVGGAEQTVRLLYDRISAEAGSVPEWAPVREMFLPESVIVLRSSRDRMSVLSLDAFIRDFEQFYATPQVREKGFEETILELKSTEFGEMAQVWVLYEARIPGGGGNRGLDNFSLIRREGSWRIAAITNEVVFPDGPAPSQMFD
ncbi:MAG: hypothetical protein P8049_01635 [Gemmatimonadota bacterium]|jgi:hypothetical protein